MKLTKINPDTIKVGDEVEDIITGFGKVVEIKETDYPICVRFESHSQPLTYTIDGFIECSDKRASIYLKIEDDE